MSTRLQEKRFKLEKQLKELEEQERKLNFNEEKEKALKAGLYTPLKIAYVSENLWRKGERDFESIGDDSYFTVDEILGEPDFREDEKVVQIKVNSGELFWVRENNYKAYYLIEESECCLDEDCNRYLYQITPLK